jgi:hypothetical protein
LHGRDGAFDDDRRSLAGTTTGISALDEPAKMSPFLNAGMKTMRSEKEFMVA